MPLGTEPEAEGGKEEHLLAVGLSPALACGQLEGMALCIWFVSRKQRRLAERARGSAVGEGCF